MSLESLTTKKCNCINSKGAPVLTVAISGCDVLSPSEHHKPKSPPHYMCILVDEEWYPRSNLRYVKGCPWKASKVRNYVLECIKEMQMRIPPHQIISASIVPLWNTSDTPSHGQPKKDTMPEIQNCELSGSNVKYEEVIRYSFSLSFL